MLLLLLCCSLFSGMLMLFVLSPFRLSKKFLGFAFFALLLVALVCPFAAFGKESVSSLADLIPPPIILREHDGHWLPSVNQFVLNPEQGRVVVQYSGMFRNSFHAKGTVLELPLPKGAHELKITIHGKAIPLHTKENVILEYPLEDDVNQIDVQFVLNASAGVLLWQGNNLKTLPGISLFLIPQASGAQLVSAPTGFELRRNGPVLELLRWGQVQDPYPVFKIKNLLPHRVFMLVLLFLCALILLLSCLVYKK